MNISVKPQKGKAVVWKKYKNKYLLVDRHAILIWTTIVDLRLYEILYERIATMFLVIFSLETSLNLSVCN